MKKNIILLYFLTYFSNTIIIIFMLLKYMSYPESDSLILLNRNFRFYNKIFDRVK